MFSGEQAHQLDSKNRIRIPAKFKGENSEKFVFCKGITPCIYVLPMSEYEKMVQKFSAVPFFDYDAQEALSFFTSSFERVEEDAQGRVVLPSMLRQMAGIKKDVITLGVGNRLEIWSAEKYQEYMLDIDYDAELEKLRI